MTEREIFEKFDNLSEDELNTKSKGVGVKKKGRKKNRWLQKKVDDSRITNFRMPRFEVKSKIGNIFVNEKVLEEYSVKIYKIDPYFYEHYGNKMQVNENGLKYILFRSDVYFIEYLLFVEIDQKGHTERDLIFEQKRQKVLEKNLVVNLLELIRVKKTVKQTMKPAEYKHLLVSLKTKNLKN